MPVTNYYTASQQTLAERTLPGTRIDYLMDALGSVSGTANQLAQLATTHQYKPYGAFLARSGSGADPVLQWAGSWGYRQTGCSHSDIYVRARHYGSLAGRWTTPDPKLRWKVPNLYPYASASPIVRIDPSGLVCLPLQTCCDAKRQEINRQLRRRCPRGFWGEVVRWPRPLPDACRTAGDCDKIWAEIETEAAVCRELCSRATRGLPPYGPAAEWVGTVVCCRNEDGTPEYCGISWCITKELYQMDPCILMCIQVHEEVHGGQPLFDCPGEGPIPRTLPNQDGAFSWAECLAYNASLHCLRNAARVRGCDAQKSKEYLDRIQVLIDTCDTASTF